MTISTGLLLTYWLAVWITHIIRHLGQGQAHLPRHRTHAGWGGPTTNWFMGLMGDLGLFVSHPCERKAWLNVNSIQHPLVGWYYDRFIYTAMSHTTSNWTLILSWIPSRVNCPAWTGYISSNAIQWLWCWPPLVSSLCGVPGWFFAPHATWMFQTVHPVVESCSYS